MIAQYVTVRRRLDGGYLIAVVDEDYEVANQITASTQLGARAVAENWAELYNCPIDKRAERALES